MHYPDFDTYCEGGCGPNVRAIGWLSNSQPFKKGPVTEEFLLALREHLTNPKQYVSYLGSHTCELCSSAIEHRNLYIPTNQFLYIAPTMILHYVEVHHYQPPKEFMEAVLTCPTQGSDDYLKAIEPFLPVERNFEQYGEPDDSKFSFQQEELEGLEPEELQELLENFPHRTSADQKRGSYIIEPEE